MFKKLHQKECAEESVQSYLGMLKHGNGYKLKRLLYKVLTIKMNGSDIQKIYFCFMSIKSISNNLRS